MLSVDVILGLKVDERADVTRKNDQSKSSTDNRSVFIEVFFE
jgi:hypothetical protein